MTTLFTTKFNNAFEIIKVLLNDSFTMIYDHHKNTDFFEVSDFIKITLKNRSVRHLEVFIAFKKEQHNIVYINAILKKFHSDRYRILVSTNPETVHVSLLIHHQIEHKYNNLLLLLISLFQNHNIPDKKYNMYTYSDADVNIDHGNKNSIVNKTIAQYERHYPVHDIENQYGNL
jgi:hypothetical protein